MRVTCEYEKVCVFGSGRLRVKVRQILKKRETFDSISGLMDCGKR